MSYPFRDFLQIVRESKIRACYRSSASISSGGSFCGNLTFVGSDWNDYSWSTPAGIADGRLPGIENRAMNGGKGSSAVGRIWDKTVVREHDLESRLKGKSDDHESSASAPIQESAASRMAEQPRDMGSLPRRCRHPSIFLKFVRRVLRRLCSSAVTVFHMTAGHSGNEGT